MALVVEEHVAVVGLGQRRDAGGRLLRRRVGERVVRRIASSGISRACTCSAACDTRRARRSGCRSATSSSSAASAASVADAVGLELLDLGPADAGHELQRVGLAPLAARIASANSQNSQWLHFTGTVGGASGAGSIATFNCRCSRRQ